MATESQRTDGTAAPTDPGPTYTPAWSGPARLLAAIGQMERMAGPSDTDEVWDAVMRGIAEARPRDPGGPDPEGRP